MSTILVTGGAGFIGSAVIRRVLRDGEHRVINVDALTYAGNLESLPGAANHPNYSFEHVNVRDASAVARCFREYRPDAVIHLAAESHVDRSIDEPGAFVMTNVVGTVNLLEAALDYSRSLPAARAQAFRVLHVSTDEVYGSLGPAGRFHEQSAYQPNSPYAASKAASDHLARAWFQTYRLPVVLTNCSNNYGPYQFPEKLVPLMIMKGIAEQPMPVYGRGEHTRDWLYVDDHVEALLAVLARGRPGETYCIGGRSERRNIDVVRAICALLDELAPRPSGRPAASLITFVADRPGHDLRYAIDSTKIVDELGATPRESFESGLRKTVEWYLANTEWTDRCLSGAYTGQRLGLEMGGAAS
ncbi:MAG: dTDP-glucose 4,6-dehydratase [Gemmatimonadota bacterium]